MSIKKSIFKVLELMFAKRPVQTSASIVQLAPSELLRGRRALVTGGTSGIGYFIAQAYLNAGAEVIITGRCKERIDTAVDSLKQYGVISGVALDNQNISSLERGFLHLCGGGQVYRYSCQ